MFSWTGVGGGIPYGGSEGAQPSALDNVVTDSMYNHILLSNFPGTSHAHLLLGPILLLMGGFLCNNFYISGN